MTKTQSKYFAAASSRCLHSRASHAARLSRLMSLSFPIVKSANFMSAPRECRALSYAFVASRPASFCMTELPPGWCPRYDVTSSTRPPTTIQHAYSELCWRTSSQPAASSSASTAACSSRDTAVSASAAAFTRSTSFDWSAAVSMIAALSIERESPESLPGASYGLPVLTP